MGPFYVKAYLINYKTTDRSRGDKRVRKLGRTSLEDSVPRAKDGLGIGRARARDRSSVFGTDQARNDVRKPHTCHCVNQM